MGVLVKPDKINPRRWWVRINHQGRHKSLSFSSKKAADLAAIKIDAALKLGHSDVFHPPTIPARVLTLAEYSETWLATLGSRIRGSTLDDYRDRIRTRILPLMGSLPVVDITRERIRAFLCALAARGNQKVKRGVWSPILRPAGLRYRKPHTLRHTFAAC